MKVELIPVIEITNYDQDIPTPGKGPYWQYADEWENYRISSSITAGFSKNFKSYSKGSFLYKTSDISDADLLVLINCKINSIGDDTENFISAFDGGYILKIDGNDKYFPQCCSGLDDIESWNNLMNEENTNHFYMGHPSPIVTQIGNKVIFNFVDPSIDESFTPPVPEQLIEIEKSLLQTAIETAKNEVNLFSERLSRINQSENLNIPDIEKILIYGIDE